MKKIIYIFFFILPAVFYAVLTGPSSYRYTVIIDPGHGGLSLNPVELHGDKYDPVERKYLVPYQQGASYGSLFEGEIAYEISEKVKEYLDLTRTSEGRKEFYAILKKYNQNAVEPKEPVRVLMSRGPGFASDLSSTYDGKTDKDYNAEYRLFDFPDFKTGKRERGMISRINSEKPDLVVSLHLDGEGPPHGALAAVVTPGFATYQKAIEYVRGDLNTRKKIRNEFKNGPYADWIQMNSGRTAFEWFLCDSWIYFTGYWSVKDGLKADPGKFKGIRQDYISWKYAGNSWPLADNGQSRTGMLDLQNIELSGKFWEREQSKAESWKREGGKEGVGGDNLYASHELLRYIRLGLLVNGSLPEKNLPKIREPHWSTWSMPTYVNAINAFLELGFLNNRYDRERLMRYKDVHAEALAVGIYSLLYGLQSQPLKINDMPEGDPLDLNKYRDYGGINYFQSVIP